MQQQRVHTQKNSLVQCAEKCWNFLFALVSVFQLLFTANCDRFQSSFATTKTTTTATTTTRRSQCQCIVIAHCVLNVCVFDIFNVYLPRRALEHLIHLCTAPHTTLFTFCQSKSCNLMRLRTTRTTAITSIKAELAKKISNMNRRRDVLGVVVKPSLRKNVLRSTHSWLLGFFSVT